MISAVQADNGVNVTALLGAREVLEKAPEAAQAFQQARRLEPELPLPGQAPGRRVPRLRPDRPAAAPR